MTSVPPPSSEGGDNLSVFSMDTTKQGVECTLYYNCRVDDTESFKELLHLSSQGNEIAKGYLAVLLLRKDLSQIAKTFSIGDHQDSASIMIEDIVPWLKAPEQENNQHALYITGFCLQYGIHWEQNGSEGLAYIRKASEMGHASAQCKLGFAYNSGTDVAQDRSIAFDLYMEAAKQGYAIAQSNVAVEYSTGSGAVPQNLAIAASYYKLAADQGDKESQYCLGYAYATGKGVDEDMEEAIKYYKLSAEKGFVYAQYSLGFCFFQGKGVPMDTEMALTYYRQAAEQGHAASQKFLTEFYTSIKEETGVKEGLGAVEQSAMWEGDLEPEELVAKAEAFYMGEGCEQDVIRAVQLYRQAADSGHAGAQFKMGTFYNGGEGGLKEDPAVAVQYFALAADQGHKTALYQLGTCFSRGVGVEVDKGEAVKYFRLAAEAQDTDASSCAIS